MAKIFIICGSTGAGKTTYSKILSQSESAQVFSIDEWMQNLFWMDKPMDNILQWALERVLRCENQICSIAEQILSAEINVILDLGFSKREQRQRLYNWAQSNGYFYQLAYLDIPVEVRRERVRLRNLNKTETFQFEVSEETFDWMESYFEPPQNDELVGAIVIQ